MDPIIPQGITTDEENIAFVVAIYEQQEHFLQVQVEKDRLNGDLFFSTEVFGSQLFSICHITPENQILLTWKGELLKHPSMPSKIFLPRKERFVVHVFSSQERNGNPTHFLEEIPSDWRKICSRATFGDLPIIQPAFRKIGGSNEDENPLLCSACAQTCTTAATPLNPFEWNSSKKIAQRFLSEIVLVCGEVDIPPPVGFKKIPYNLNTSASGDYIFLCYQRCNSKDTHSTQRILSQITVENNKKKSSFKYLSHDCNRGNGSKDQVFIGYQTIFFQNFQNRKAFGITDVSLVLEKNKALAFSKGFIVINTNLNMGANGAEALYLAYRIAPLGSFVCEATENYPHGDFGECLFATRYLKKQNVSLQELGPKRLLCLKEMITQRQQLEDNYMENHYRKGEATMLTRLKSSFERVKVYELKHYQEEALKRIPVEKLHERVRSNSSSNNLPSYRDELLKQLLHWFKTEFFSWTNCPKCHVCGHEKTHHFRTEPPFTQEEIQGEASRVEIYQCFQCKSFTRFPRYNNPLKLLDTRHGRCGEWANCFTLCCRSMGFETRYVLDVTDHVWTEVFSEYEKRWLHCDSCENQLDCPLTYEIGWGKKLSYIFSFSHEEIVDSMRRYTQNYDDILYTRRHEVSEKWLSETICRMNQEIRQEISMERIAILQKREKIEKKEFEICQQQKKIKADEIHGRISGSKEWKDARNESGSISTTKFSKNNATLQVQHEEQDKEICTLMTTLTMKDTICQKLLLNLLKGCDNVKCPNPFCLHTQKRLRPDLSPNDRAVEAIELIGTFCKETFSVESLSSLLCPVRGSLPWLLLGGSNEIALPFELALLYAPLQDRIVSMQPNASSRLVDLTKWKEGHFLNPSKCPLGRSFLMRDHSGEQQIQNGLELSNNQCSISWQLASKNLNQEWLLSFFFRSDFMSATVSFQNEKARIEDQTILCIHLDDQFDLSLLTKKNKSTKCFVMKIQLKSSISKIAVTSKSFLLFGCYHHLCLVQSKDKKLLLWVDGNPTELQVPIAISESKNNMLTFVGTDQVDSNGFPIVSTVISHVFLHQSGAEIANKLASKMIQSYLCTAPLASYGVDGRQELNERRCTQKEAQLQSGFFVSKINMWGTEFFDGIQFVYERTIENTERKEVVEGVLSGNKSAKSKRNEPTASFELLPDEYITGLTGRKGAWTDCIRLETNYGRVLSCGGSGGDEFRVLLPSGTEIRAVSFDVNDHLTNVLAYVGDAFVNVNEFVSEELKQNFEKIFQGLETKKRQEVISGILRYLKNWVQAPNEPKFQRIRVSNGFFQKNIATNLMEDKCTQLMTQCGFQKEQKDNETTFYVLPQKYTKELQVLIHKCVLILDQLR